ncbi:MAG: family 16 glycoside hydrolase [Thermodesulfobacteriota bacterium]
MRLYRVVGSKREELASADIDIPSGQWHTIKIRMKANHIHCFYDGKKAVDMVDDTFKKSGKVGLWVKADAVTYFDDLEIVAK